MNFEQLKKRNKNEEEYHIENLRIARDFSKELLTEMNELVKAIVLFGSTAKNTLKKNSDIDILVILDNIGVFVTPELREAYRIITTKLTSTISSKIHLITLNLSDFWDMNRKGDPVLVNILRSGFPLFDRDLVEPMQYLLEIGKIRPTREAAFNYMARSQTLLEETSKHIEEAHLDLYYSLIDMLHATLMTKGIIAPSPAEMPNLFKKTFAKEKAFGKFAKDITQICSLAKKIEKKQGAELTGTNFEKYRKKTQTIISKLYEYTQKEIENKDLFEF